MNRVKLYAGDCLEVLKRIPDSSIDSCVTDPPYGLSKEPDIAKVMQHWIDDDDYMHTAKGFMGKAWDSFVPGPKYWREVHRVLKPGGYALVFGGTRTYDMMTIALRFAGFEVRDTLSWVYGSGFPKSLDVSKAIDKQAGAEREKNPDPKYVGQNKSIFGGESDRLLPATPATPAAQQWEGWGTALKPAHEPIIMCRKPLSEGTVAANVLKWGTGGINIDDCRIRFAGEKDLAAAAAHRSLKDQNKGRTAYGKFDNGPDSLQPYLEKMGQGRFPANFILSCLCTETHDLECPVHMLDAQSGTLKTNPGTARSVHKAGSFGIETKPGRVVGVASTGGASRFFYVAKASKRERNAGLEGMGGKSTYVRSGTNNPSPNRLKREDNFTQNTHPTVKPLTLMRYLTRLVTPPEGRVLDPFMGSGSTGCAAVKEGFAFTGIEREAAYLEIAKRRIGVD